MAPNPGTETPETDERSVLRDTLAFIAIIALIYVPWTAFALGEEYIYGFTLGMLVVLLYNRL